MEKPKGFRLVGKNFFLTYSNLEQQSPGTTPDHIIGGIENDLLADKWEVCWEYHADGSLHCHALVFFSKKVDSIDPHHFDIAGCHPNIQRPPPKTLGAKLNRWKQTKLDYIWKDGKFVSHGFRSLPSSSMNYLKVKADIQAYKNDHIYAALEHPFPFKLPNGVEQKQPPLHEKKNNWLIIGDSDAGKGKWLYETFNGKKHLYVGPKGHSGRFDNYVDQRVFIYDDHDDYCREELIKISNLAPLGGSMTLPARYCPKLLETGVRRVIIIICNPGKAPSFQHDEAFTTRFNVIDMNAMSQ